MMKWNFVKIWNWHVEIIVGYTLNKFWDHNIVVDDGKIYNFKIKKWFFLKK